MKEAEKLKLLVKADRRKQWKLLKTKHAKVIKEKVVEFDSGFGKALDTYQAQVDKLAKLAARSEVKTAAQVRPVVAAAEPLLTIAFKYQTQVKAKLPDPAKKELSSFLSSVLTDAKGWKSLSDALASNAKDYSYGEGVAGIIAQLMEYLEEPVKVIVERAGRAAEHYGDRSVERNTKFASLASKLYEAGRLFSPARLELQGLAVKASKGTNYKLFKTRAEAVGKLADRLHKASLAYKQAWDQQAPDDSASGDGPALYKNHAELDRHYEILKLRVAELREGD